MLRLMLLAGLVTAATLVSAFQPPGSHAQTRNADQFIVGVLREDGVIVPFAQYRKGQWLNPWPKPDCHCEEPDIDEPNTLTDHEKPWFERYVKPSSRWYLSSGKEADVNQPSVIRTKGIVKVDSHCASIWGLAWSDTPIPQDNVGYHAKRSVALSADRKLSSVSELSDASPDFSRVRDFVAVDFSRAETVGLSRMAEYGIPIDIPATEERNRVSLSLRKLYAGHLESGQLIYYFETRKEYPKPSSANDSGCNNFSVLSGWIVRDPDDRLRLIDSQAYVTDCDLKEGSLKTPLGILIVGGRTFVILEELGYEDESYVILELRDSGIHLLLQTYAGGC